MKPAHPLLKACLVASLALATGGCGKSGDHADHADPAAAASHKHEHTPPHGGTPVVLGHEEGHVELVRDAAAGRLTAYVMDGELENFVRVSAPALIITAKVGGQDQTLTLLPVANAATGEKVGDTSQFEVAADWLKATGTFDGSLKEITIKGKPYRDIGFNFPKGNE